MPQRSPDSEGAVKQEFLRSKAVLLFYFLDPARITSFDNPIHNLFMREFQLVAGNLAAHDPNILENRVSMAISMLQTTADDLSPRIANDPILQHERFEKVKQAIAGGESLPIPAEASINPDIILGWMNAVYLSGWQGGQDTEKFASEIVDRLAREGALTIHPYRTYECTDLFTKIIKATLQNAALEASYAHSNQAQTPDFLRGFVREIRGKIDRLDQPPSE